MGVSYIGPNHELILPEETVLDMRKNKEVIDAERWAKTMTALAKQEGTWIGPVANEASHLADDEGVTGFQVCIARELLQEYWFYGDVLPKAERIGVYT